MREEEAQREREENRIKVLLDLKHRQDTKVAAGLMTRAAADAEYAEERSRIDHAGRKETLLVGPAKLPGRGQTMTR